MNHCFRSLFTLLTLFLFCPLAVMAASYPEDSPYSTIPHGSVLVLKSPITIPAGTISVKLTKKGDPPSAVHPYQYDTECRLMMRSRSGKSRVIDKGTFIIRKARKDEEYVSRDDFIRARSAAEGGGPGWEIHEVFMFLSSVQYPDVYGVECRYQDTYGEGMPLSVTLVRWALSGEFDLMIK